MKEYEYLLLALVATTVDYEVHRCMAFLPVGELTWIKTIELAGRHGVRGLVFSAIELLPREARPPMRQIMSLYGQTELQKARYYKQFSVAEKFAAALDAKGVRMNVLKGISFSTYYDKPFYRECGDCDCYLTSASHPATEAGSNGFEIGNKTIVEIGGKAEFGTYKHSHLYLDGLMLENHHYITDFNGTRQGRKTELLLERAIDCEPGTPIPGSHMLRPSAHFCVLHCLRHAQGNFMSGGMILRMLYDWAMIMRSEQNRLDWSRLRTDIADMRLDAFAGVMTSLCERYLGLRITACDVIRCNDADLVEAVMMDVLRSDIHPRSGESIWRKTFRILRRFMKMYRFRRFAVESVPTMIWNSFAFSSYLRRNIELS